MRQIVQTLAMSAAFTVAGALAYEAAVEYGRRAELRVKETQTAIPPAAGPTIPDAMKASLRASFGGR